MDDSMWKTLFMNVNKISIAKEILETKLKSPTLRMKLIPAWLWDANTPKTNSLSAKFKRGMAGWSYSWRSSPPWGFAKTLITRFQTMIDMLGQTWHSCWTFSMSAFAHGNKVVGFGLKTIFLINILGLQEKLSRWKTKMEARQNHNFSFCNIWRFLLRAMVDKTRMDLNLCEYAPHEMSRYMLIVQWILTSLICFELWECFQKYGWKHGRTMFFWGLDMLASIFHRLKWNVLKQRLKRIPLINTSQVMERVNILTAYM